MKHVAGFFRFWYGFIVGDDWHVAAGIAVAVALTAVLSDAGISAWWVVPAGVVAVMHRSLQRASRSTRR
jgi:hypothetical protein